MAGVQDPLTDLPPPSRFDFDELSNFAFCPPSPPSPTIVWAPSAPAPLPSQDGIKLCTSFLLISTSAAGCHLVHHLPRKVLIGTVTLSAEASSAQTKSVHPSLSDRACYLYACDDEASMVLASVQYAVPADQARAWARTLFDAIDAEEVLVLSSVSSEHFRGKLSADDQLLFRLETDLLRSSPLPDGGDNCVVPYYPSGSLVEGIPAAILSWCQMRHRRARLLLSWPDTGSAAISHLVSVLVPLLGKLKNSQPIDFGPALKAPFKGKSPSNLEIYF